MASHNSATEAGAYPFCQNTSRARRRARLRSKARGRPLPRCPSAEWSCADSIQFLAFNGVLHSGKVLAEMFLCSLVHIGQTVPHAVQPRGGKIPCSSPPNRGRPFTMSHGASDLHTTAGDVQRQVFTAQGQPAVPSANCATRASMAHFLHAVVRGVGEQTEGSGLPCSLSTMCSCSPGEFPKPVAIAAGLCWCGPWESCIPCLYRLFFHTLLQIGVQHMICNSYSTYRTTVSQIFLCLIP